HKVINRKAVDYFPEEMSAFKAWKDYLGEHASDADLRKKDDKSENPKHFIDIDYYKEFLEGRMIENMDSLISIYGEKIVKKIGLLPWATVETYFNLVSSFKEHNRDKALIYASDLGHYVADGHQPMHACLNYNGQLTNQNGVHLRFESNLVDRYISEIDNSFVDCKVEFVKSPLDFVFNYVTEAYSVSVVLFDGDKYATEKAGSNSSDEYYRLYWFKTKYVTEIQFNKAAQDLAALIYSAWVDAGKPGFSLFD
ncbi:MAG TPA: hypothetical protein VKA26_01770, partial [Ignavibacteriaceae bacterium]|nr:hypothetical protein [Ignavibacteriaceae bacterium]